MKKAPILDPPGFCTSVSFRGLAPEIDLVCAADRPEIEVLGLGLRDMGVV
jgi:hypothetical protein